MKKIFFDRDGKTQVTPTANDLFVSGEQKEDELVAAYPELTPRNWFASEWDDAVQELWTVLFPDADAYDQAVNRICGGVEWVVEKTWMAKKDPYGRTVKVEIWDKEDGLLGVDECGEWVEMAVGITSPVFGVAKLRPMEVMSAGLTNAGMLTKLARQKWGISDTDVCGKITEIANS